MSVVKEENFQRNMNNLNNEDISIDLDNRKTDEMIIGLVGPVGSGVTKTASIIKEKLEKDYNYSVKIIKISDDIIAKNSYLVEVYYDVSLSGDKRTQKLQEIGTKLRNEISVNFLAEKCIERIALDRLDGVGYNKEENTLVPNPRRTAYIIDSLKHPDEYNLFRDVYGDFFWLFGVFAPEQIREERLKRLISDTSKIRQIFNIDEEEGKKNGQKVRDTIELSDFFIRNDKKNSDNLNSVIDRYLKLIFGIGIITPTRDEAAMYTAVSAASSSACLSRQVGASIYSEKGELLGKGANDVPKNGGGLYCSEDHAEDHRCHKFGDKNCHNDTRKEALYKSIESNLRNDGHLKSDSKYTDIKISLKKTDIKQLIEYSRAVHAEMEAIISVARAGKSGLIGSTLYCTTFPCHSCARHIVASGISKVIYIEPYPKSLATTLHSDSISTNDSDHGRYVTFLQYEGVAPKNMIRLFKQKGERKKDSVVIEKEQKNAHPISRSPLDGFTTREQIIVNRLQGVEQKLK